MRAVLVVLVALCVCGASDTDSGVNGVADQQVISTSGGADPIDESASPVPLHRHIVFVADDWGSAKGGVCTANRSVVELLAKHSNETVRITVLLPEVTVRRKMATRAGSSEKVAVDDVEDMAPEVAQYIEQWKDSLPLGERVTFVYVRGKPDHEFDDWLVELSGRKEGWEGKFFSRSLTRPVDIVLGHGTITGRGASALAKHLGARYWHMVHTLPDNLSFAHGEVSDAKRKREMDIIRGNGGEFAELQPASLVLGLGPLLESDWTRYLDVPFLALDPWLREERIATAGTRPAPGSAGAHLLTVGRMVQFEQKGVLLPAAAMTQIDEKRWRAAGEPKYRLRGVDGMDNFKEIMKAAKTSDHFNLSFASVLEPRALASSEQVREDLRMTDAMLLPSIAEAFGLVALEAMEEGVPVLTSSDTGFAKQLRKSNATAELRALADGLVVDVAMDEGETVKVWKRKLEEYITLCRDVRMRNDTTPDDDSWVRGGERLRDAYRASFPAQAAANALLRVMSMQRALRDTRGLRWILGNTDVDDVMWRLSIVIVGVLVGVVVGVVVAWLLKKYRTSRVVTGGNFSSLLAKFFHPVPQWNALIDKLTGYAKGGVHVLNLHGVAGMGKTTLCSHVADFFANARDRPFDIVLWVDGNLEVALTRFARTLRIDGHMEMSQAEKAAAVLDKLRTAPKRWLLVIVRADQSTPLGELPCTQSLVDGASGGCVLVASTNRLNTISGMEYVSIEAWSEEDAVKVAAYLSDMTKMSGGDRAAVASAVAKLSPQGINIAAAYVRRKAVVSSARELWKEIADDPFIDDAFRVIDKAIGTLGEPARQLLLSLAVLHPQRIPLYLFDEKRQRKALTELITRSLLLREYREENVRMFNIHPSVQEAVSRNSTAADTTATLSAMAQKLVDTAPSLAELEVGKVDAVERVLVLLPHMQHVFDHLEQGGGRVAETLGARTAYALNKAASRIGESKDMWRRVQDVAASQAQRKHYRAREMHMAMLECKSSAAALLGALGSVGTRVTKKSEAIDMSTALQRTFLLRKVEGKEDEAAALYEIIRKGTNTDAITRSRANFNLALVWKENGKKRRKAGSKEEGAKLLREARTLLEGVVGGWKKKYGDDAELSLEGDANVAKLMVLTGDVADGLAMYKDAVRRSEAAMGSEHYQTLLTKFFCAKMMGTEGSKRHARKMMVEFREAFSTLFSSHRMLTKADKLIEEWKSVWHFW